MSKDIFSQVYAGSAWIGASQADYYAGLVGTDEGGKPSYAIYEKYNGKLRRYSDTTYETLEEALRHAYEVVAAKNYD